TSNVTCFAICVPLLLLLLAVAGEDRQHVFLRDDQVLDLVDLEFVAGVLGVEHLVADLELHRHLGAVVQDPSGPHGLDDALLGLLLGGVRKDNPALGLFLFLDRLDHYAVGQRSQVHVQPSSAESVSTPYARALSTLAGRLLIVVPTGLAPLDVLRPFIKRRRLGFLDQAAGGFGLVVRDHDPGVGQVDPDPVSVVAEDLDPHPVGPQHRSHEVGLDTLALEDDGPAFDAHGYQLREGSTSAGWTAAWLPAAAIIAALSVHSSSGGIVSRARPSTSSAARVRSSELAATPPATTTSVRCGASRIARSSFSRSDSTTDCSNAAARSARSWSVTLSPRSRSRYSSAVFRPLKLYSRPGSEGRGRGWRLGLPVRAMRSSAGPPGKPRPSIRAAL